MLSLSYIYFTPLESGSHPWASAQQSPVPSCPAHHPLPTSAGSYHLTGSRIVVAVLLQYLLIFLFIAWGSYVWVNVKDFGSQSECNDRIKYAILFFTVRATAPWLRRLWIAFFAIYGTQGLASLIAGTAVFLHFEKREKKREENWEERMDPNEGWVKTTETRRRYATNSSYFHLDTSRLL